MVTPSPVPDSFLSKVLNEFGLQWTHLAIFSGVAFAGFGLDRYLNAGAWMLTAVFSFVLVFLFRHDISSRFSIVFASALAVMVAGLLGGNLYARRFPGGALAYMEANKAIATIFCGIVVCVPLATTISSYRRSELMHGGTFPREIREAIRENIANVSFFKRKQVYAFTVTDVSEQFVKVNSVLSYIIVNRTSAEKVLTMTLTPMREQVHYIAASIGDQNLDMDNPAYRTEHGLQVTRTFAPKIEIPVRLEMDIWYRSADSDLLASYLPTTDFELILTNPFPDLRIVVESLFREQIHPSVEGPTKRYKSTGGSIPYQGFKLDWMPRGQAAVGPTTKATGGGLGGQSY